MTRSDFLQELKLQYEKEFERKNSLENKSNYLVTVSGIVIPLLFTFGGFIIEKIEPSYSYIDIIKFILLLILAFNVGTIFLGIIGYSVKDYYYAFRGENFNNKDGSIKKEEVDAYIGYNTEEFQDKMIKVYIRCNRINRELNDFKGFIVYISQFIFLIGFLLIPIMLLILFLYLPKILN